ncbi:MAG TPA: carbohydrate-binding family V/XII, partial [Paraburkholderia sp.]|nr:carbohydrate-binding family V/XII [Paraburkholderia sp.]
MKTTMKRSLLLLASVCTSLTMTLATPAQALAAAAVQPLPTVWPRDFDNGQQRVELYQPQVEVWEGNRVEGRQAFAVGAKGATPNYGVAHFVARAEIDKISATVQLLDIVIDQVDMPATPAAAADVKAALQARIPKEGLTTSLEQLQA